MNKHLVALAKTAFVAVAAYAAFSTYSRVSPYSLVWNRTASIPLGVYLAKELRGSAIERGELGCFDYAAPDWARERHYFPDGFRLCKPVVGMPGDVIERDGATLRLRVQGADAVTVGTYASTDSRGRPMPQDALSTGAVPEGSLLLVAGAHANSLDSRYLGLIPARAVRLRLTPLLTW